MYQMDTWTWFSPKLLKVFGTREHGTELLHAHCLEHLLVYVIFHRRMLSYWIGIKHINNGHISFRNSHADWLRFKFWHVSVMASRCVTKSHRFFSFISFPHPYLVRPTIEQTSSRVVVGENVAIKQTNNCKGSSLFIFSIPIQFLIGFFSSHWLPASLCLPCVCFMFLFLYPHLAMIKL